MATYYVETTGNNNNDGLAPATAWLTLEKAETACSDGDTVYVGTLTDGGIFEATTYFTPAKQIAWITTRDSILRGNNNSRVLYLNSNKTKSFTGFVIDCDSSGTSPIYHFEGSGVDQLTTFENCNFIHGNTTAIRLASGMRGVTLLNCTIDAENEDQVLQMLGGVGGFTMRGCTINVPAGIVMNGVLVQLAALTSGVVRVDGNTINVLPNYAPIRFISGGMDDLEITDNVINVATNNQRTLIELRDIENTCLISGNTIEFESVWEGCLPIGLTSTVGAGPDCVYTIEDNVINMSKADGYGILIGDEGGDITSKAGAFNGSIIRRNVMRAAPYYNLPIGNLHGIMMGGNINIFYEENYVYGAAYAAVCKGQGEAWTDGYIQNNIFEECQHTVRYKGQKDIRCANNVFIGTNGDLAECMAITDNTVGGSEATGSFTRNNIYSINTGYAIETADTSHVGMTSDYNCFHLTGTAKAGNINGVIYDTLEDLQAAGYDLNSISADPKLKTDRTIDAASPCFEKGIPITGVTHVYDSTKSYEITLAGASSLSMDSPYKNRVPIT